MPSAPSASPENTFELLNAVVTRLGGAILAIWGVLEDGTCRCPKGKKCESPGKHPNYKLCPNGFKNATRDTAILRQWIRQAPNGNWAMRCGDPLPGGGYLGAFDTDPRNGSVETLEALGEELPETVTDQTGRGDGGGHRIYRFAVSPASRSLGPGLDLQGAGKYIVIAPSRHECGGVYTWELGLGPDDVPVAKAPQWMDEGTEEAVPRPATDGGTARETVLGYMFEAIGKAGPVMPDGSMMVCCPMSHTHSDARGRGEDASCVILPPAGGSKYGGFKCLHGHCANLKWKEVEKAFPKEIVEAAHKKYPRLGLVPNDAKPPPADPEDQEGPKSEEDQLREMSKRLNYKTVGDGFVLKKEIVNLNIILTHDPRWKGILRYDDFAQCLRFTRPPPWHPEDAGKGTADVWTDEDVTRMDLWLRRTWALELESTKIREVVYVVGRRESMNPLQDYLNALTWDGTARLETWLAEYAGVLDTPYARSVGRKWMISAVARALDPGCKVDTCLILEGPQGKGKSTLLRSLVPQPSWFSDTPIDIGNKDAYVALRGKWIIELAELASLRKADLDRTKAFFSSPVDSYRPPYGREQVSVARTSVFAGSVNLGEYLNDATGARRFLPVYCGVIDIQAVIADRDQLWAEAVSVYKAWVKRGRPQSECLWWPSYEEQSVYEEQQAMRQVAGSAHPWIEAIAKWCASGHCKHLLADSKIGYLTIRQIIINALEIPDKDFKSDMMTSVGITITRDLGWEKERVLVNGVKTWGYRPKTV